MSSAAKATCMFIPLEEDTVVSKQLSAFWEIESLGITREKKQNPAEEEALQMFERTTTFKDGRYHVALSWKQERAELQDNYMVAKMRFEGLKKRLKKDVTFYSRYKDNTNADTVKYYLPHHAVLREDKVTTKLRVVFDASSHEDGCPSLNDCLLTGPNLNPDLLTVLIKFRKHEIAFMPDIKKKSFLADLPSGE